MHSTLRYRKAKKFKLQYDEGTAERDYRDGEYFVADEFSGHSKKPIKRDWGDGHYIGNKHSRPERYLESRVGDLWNSVWSDVCRLASHHKPVVANWMRERVERAVERTVEIIDGVPCSRWRIGGSLTEVSAKQLYVDPATGLLCITAERPRGRRYSDASYRTKLAENEKVVQGVKFSLQSIEYKRKIACDVFETVVNKVWMKHIEYKYWDTEPYTVREFGPHSAYNWKNKRYESTDCWHLVYKTRSVQRTSSKKVTASKKDIRDFKLNHEGE